MSRRDAQGRRSARTRLLPLLPCVAPATALAAPAGGMLAGDLASSIGATAEVAAVAMLLGALVGVTLGWAIERASIETRRAADGVARALACAPALLAMIVVAGAHRPVRGFVSVALLLAVVAAGVFAHRIARALRAARELPHVRFARNLGVSARRVFAAHLWPALAPALAHTTAEALAYVLAATLVIEPLLGWPGVGALALRALASYDALHLGLGLLVIAVPIVGTRVLVWTVHRRRASAGVMQ